MSSLKADNLEELLKLDKLLDKTEHELKKKRDEKVYTQSEKFVEHMKKTTDVYTLIIEEVIGSLYVMGFTEHTNVLRKLFKGVQLQTNSILKFALKYYSNKNKELKRGKQNEKDKNSNRDGEVLVLIDKYTELPYCPLKGQQTQNFSMGVARNGGGRAQPKGNLRPGAGQNVDTRSPQLNRSSHLGDTSSTGMFRQSFGGENSFHSAAPPYRGGYPGHPPYPKSNYHNHHQEEFDYFYNQEQDQMNREIAELLEGRKNLENIGPSEASQNLRQVLKGLEGVKKKVKALGEAEDPDEDHPKPDLEKMTSTIIGAFDKAQKKTAKKAIGYVLAKEKEGPDSHEVGTMPDNDMLEAYKRQLRFEVETQLSQKTDELMILKKKFALLESDRNDLHDKYTKVTVAHSRCEQVERELKMKLVQVEKELATLKEIIEEVKKGKVERLNLSKEQQNNLKKSVVGPANNADVSEELMQKLQESRKEMKILKYQLENNGKKPPVGLFENEPEEEVQLSSGKFVSMASLAKAKAMMKKSNNDIGPVKAVEVEEQVMVNGKLTAQKKTVYKQLKKVVTTNSKGEKVEVEEEEDVDPNDVQVDKDGKVTKINNGKTSPNKKQVKIVTKDKNGHEVVAWQDAEQDDSDDDEEDSAPPTEKRTTSDGQVLKKVVSKDKNGREVVEWLPSTDPEDEPGVEESVGGMTIKTTEGGKTFAKVVTKDKKGNDVVQWVEVTAEQVEAISGGAEGVTEIKGANGQVLKKIVTVDENGEEKVEWVPTGPIIKNTNGGKKSQQNTARKQNNNGVVTLQEEVEEEVIEIDENGNQHIVKKKVIKTKQVKKTVDENGEEIIIEEVIDEVTGQKKTVVKKLRDMHNVRLMEPGPVHYDSATEREKITARGSKKVTKNRDTQTSFAVEELIQTALQSAGIGGAALQEINKALAKQGIDIVKYVEDKKKRKSTKGEGEEFEYVNIPGVGKKKVFFTKGDDFEEVEYVTKEGKKIKRKIPVGEKDDYEMNEQGELVYTGKKLQKFRSTNKKYQGHLTDEGEEEDMLNQSMESVMSTDENGKLVKKYRPKKDSFEPIGKAKKITIDEILRQQEELDSQRPPASKDEAQARAMYKAMLTKAKGDPKLMNLFKTYLKEKGVAIDDEENFIADFDTFQEYVKHFRETHGKCGDNCMHLQRFYARIGYYPIWNNRVPLPMTRPDIANHKARPKVVNNHKLPEIKKNP